MTYKERLLSDTNRHTIFLLRVIRLLRTSFIECLDTGRVNTVLIYQYFGYGFGASFGDDIVEFYRTGFFVCIAGNRNLGFRMLNQVVGNILYFG